jgi:tripartite-type tricarboxylate transporter receptor subunit TctC
MLVAPAFPAETVAQLVAFAKANPGRINMASAGNGTPPHVAGELFKRMTGTDMLHVPYRGVAPAITDLLSGQVQVLFDPVPSSIGYVRAGKLRALAVTTAQRSALLPDTPALAEVVRGYEASTWFGIGAPRATPPEIVGRLNATVNAVQAEPAMQARLADLGASVFTTSPAEFATFIAGETDKWARIVKQAGIRPD